MKPKRDINLSESGGRGFIPGLLRISFVILLCLMQILLLMYLSRILRSHSSLAYYIFLAIGIVAVLVMLSSSNSSSYKISWIMIFLIFPLPGIVLYIAWGNVDFNRREKGFIQKSFHNAKTHLRVANDERNRFVDEHPEYIKQMYLLERQSYPIYQNTKAEYYALGDEWWPALLEDLEKAENFIFMEFFIITDGELWRSVFEILTRKAEQGVRVCLMYDDMGSVLSFSKGDLENIRKTGIELQVFNPVNRYISSLYINYRNHQKIVVIDKNVGYVGGTNLADEYANLIVRHGHWKDTCMRLEGDAVWSLCCIFLEMWDLNRKELTTNYDDFRPDVGVLSDAPGYYLPMADGPGHIHHNTAMDMYKLMIGSAQNYCYMTTPYLVLDDEFVDVLCLAAHSGVDIRIIVPFVPDHWYVDLATKSYYKELLNAGVRIYEYTPGYIHAKMVIADDTVGILGSINMDFRSFFLHYEDAVWMCDTPVLTDMRQDIEHTLSISEEITLEHCKNYPLYKKVGQHLMRVFAPLM